MTMKSVLRSTLARVGLEVHRRRPGASMEASLFAMMRLHGINIVFDVGANTGQFGNMLRRAGYKGTIVSFEPLEREHAILRRNAAGDKSWRVAERVAVGALEGESVLFVAGNSVSSSVLPMLEEHRRAAPASEYVGQQRVPVRQLDRLVAEYLTSDSVAFLKIDTQGYEREVMAGAPNTLRNATGIEIEMSLVPLYAGQAMYEENLEILKGLGFQLWNLSPAFFDPVSGRLLQVDAVFFRN